MGKPSRVSGYSRKGRSNPIRFSNVVDGILTQVAEHCQANSFALSQSMPYKHIDPAARKRYNEHRIVRLCCYALNGYGSRNGIHHTTQLALIS